MRVLFGRRHRTMSGLVDKMMISLHRHILLVIRLRSAYTTPEITDQVSRAMLLLSKYAYFSSGEIGHILPISPPRRRFLRQLSSMTFESLFSTEEAYHGHRRVVDIASSA